MPAARLAQTARRTRERVSIDPGVGRDLGLDRARPPIARAASTIVIGGWAAIGQLLAVAAVALAPSQASAWETGSPPSGAATLSLSQDVPPAGVNFRGETASTDARDLANWVAASRDNHALPFMIVDKIAAKVFVFDGNGGLRGAAAALLGLGRGDDSVAGIGHRRLATITPAERTTPAGRFEAALGHDFEQDVLWIDYETALSLHRVIVGNPKDRRAARLASASVLDNRISFGCVNVPAAFYDGVVKPAFSATVGIVYILPEMRPLRAVFALRELPPLLAAAGEANVR